MRFHVLDVSLACFSAILLILSFPPFGYSALAWIALVPLLIALEGKGLKRAYFLAALSGLVFAAAIFYWNFWSVDAFNLLDYLVLAAYVSLLYGGLFGLGLNWIRQRTGLSPSLVAPALWVTLEYARANASFLSAPWMLLAHSQYLHPSLMQITSWTGVYGLTFLIVLVNAALAEAIQYARRRPSGSSASSAVSEFPLSSVTAAGMLLIATILYGLFIISQEVEGERFSIGVLQGNVPYLRKWDPSSRQRILARYSELTREAARAAPTLIIWPETAVPGDVQNDPGLQQKLGLLAVETKAYLLVGSAENRKFTKSKIVRRSYNSMVLFSPEGKVTGSYRKLRLVPFGEYEPLEGIVKWPKALVSAMDHFFPGDEFTLFTAGAATFGATICWENTFPDLFRQFVKRGAQFMINATDEGLFGNTAASDQLLAMSTFQAVMNRVAIARSANMGISAFIDPFGRITARLQGPRQKTLFEDGILISAVPLSKEKPFYTRFGDVFAYLQFIVSGLLLSYAGMRGRIYILQDVRVTQRR